MNVVRAGWSRVEQLFHRAVTLDAAQRDRFLDRHCAHDPTVRREVEELLRADGDLSRTWAGLAPIPDPESEPVPAVPGYRDVTFLGRGGMGTVYLAHRHDALFEGKPFAIKVLHAHRAGPRAVRRFDTERRLLAGLDHPSIVRLHDGGTLDDGRPYLVMDHVAGRPLDVFCREQRAPVRTRLAVFRRICDALHYAHQNLVIHRDLKPSNILVDPDGVPHLLDFGIAKRLVDAPAEGGAPGTADGGLAVTTTGAWLVPMTPAYASPEQIQGQPATTASDIFSLGLVLFELLTDRLPPPRAAAATRDVEPPRVSSMVAPGRGQGAARRTTAARLRRQLAGDLDHIVAKALRSAPAARYASARELAEDLGRHLDHRPVLARRGSWRYLGGRFVRRHRVGAAVAGCLVLVVAFGTLAWVQSQRLAAARSAGAQSERLVRRLVGPQTDLLMAEGALDRAVADIVELRLPDEDKILLLDTVRRLHVPGDQLFLQVRQLVADARRGGRADPQLARVARVVGELIFHGGRFEIAEATLREAAGLAELAHAPEAPVLAAFLEAHAQALAELERYDEGVALLRRAVHLRGGVADRPQNAAVSLASLATLLYLKGAFAESAAACRRGLALLDRVGGGETELRAALLSSLSVALLEIDERDPDGAAEAAAREALALHVAALGPGHMRSLTARNNLAVVLGRSGRLEQSLATSLELLEQAENTLGRDHPRLGYVLTAIAAAHSRLGHPGRCVEHARRAVTLRERGLPADSWLTALSKTRLADCLATLGHEREAIVLLRASIATFEASKVEETSWLTFARNRLDELAGEPSAAAADL